ncbi:hypothetical protein Acr_03g0012850 [Actinidia rufa]|uniref:Integrase catalytic domain-containing protein n=1 Tax=Actinidia rufa TaxID=165716 RepID=A0A7J0EDH2_9ERIC|nr:hypothetical protein Acr_03g0012850 [Actinidia rufa]
MHLRSRYLPRPSASSPLDNRAHPMANTSQVPNLEGLHREIHDMAEQMRIMNENNGRLMQLLTAANPQLPAAPPVPDIERSRHSDRSGDCSQNITRARKGRSPHRGDQIKARNKSTSQKIRDLDAQLNAINTRTNAPVIVDTLIRQTEPPFTERVLKARISSKFKLPAQLSIYEGKTNLMDHLDSDKVIIMAMTEGLRPGPLFDSLFKNVPETLSALQSKTDKYIAGEELAEAKRRQRGKDDHKRKEPDTRRIDYREETRNKRLDRDLKRSNDRHPRETNNTKPLEEVVPISIHPEYPDCHIMIGTELTDELHFALINFLKKNSDVFARSQGDVPNIDLEIAMHKLFTNPKHSPVRQKRRKFAPERLKVIENEEPLWSKVIGEENNSPRIFLADHRTRRGYVYKEMRQVSEVCPRQPSWPFAQWGIDILGPQLRAPLQRKFWIVAIDYFTKWIEAQPLAKITEKNTQDFVWKHLICRFGIPKVIISDNARQFDNDKFKLFCSDLAISHHFSSLSQPQANGQVEITNRTILRNLKASRAQTQPGSPRGEKRKRPNYAKQLTKCQVAKYYNQRVKHRSFLPGDLVLRRVTLSTKEPNAGKLGPTWEGPYKVIKVSRPGTYWLEDPNEKELLHPWNAEHLKKYYQ